MPGKTPDEMFASEEAAKRYVAAKLAASAATDNAAGTTTTLGSTSTASIVSAPKSEVSGYTAAKSVEVASCTLAHAVSIRGTETRTVSAKKLDYVAAGLKIWEAERGLVVEYTGSDGRRYTFMTPWANVVEVRYT